MMTSHYGHHTKTEEAVPGGGGCGWGEVPCSLFISRAFHCCSVWSGAKRPHKISATMFLKIKYSVTLPGFHSDRYEASIFFELPR